MKVMVGTKNPAKLEAVSEILLDYPHLKDAEVAGMEVDSGVSDQPLSLEELTQGAINRANAAFGDCDYSIGIESGLMPVPNSKSGYMNVCACAISDGKDIHLGLSSGFEVPNREAMELVSSGKMTLDKAANAVGLTTDPLIGRNLGVSGILTRGVLDRKEFSKQALRTALIHIDTI